MDFQDFASGGKSNRKLPSNTPRAWWKLKGTDQADSISATLNALLHWQSSRINQSVISARLYGNMALLGVSGISYSQVGTQQHGLKERITYNVVQSVIDTLTSKMAKNKPKPYFLTSGGDYKAQRKAKKLNQFVEGVFYENDAYALGIDAFRDACVWGDGVIHVFEKNGRVALERVPITELYVDEIEAFDGCPRQLHRVKQADRDVLKDLFPEHKKDLNNANAAYQNQTGKFPNVADQVTIRESWHLPSGEDAKDGKHVISIDGAILFTEDWEHDYFPFARFSWCKKMWGYWAQGLCEQIQHIQMEINKLLWLVQRSFHMAGTFKVFLENGSKVVKEHLNNDIGVIINYTGQAPVFYVPQIVPKEIFEHLLTLKQNAYEQAGVSMLNATSEKPAGINSGKALREYEDINTDRFQTVGQAYQDFYLDIAKLAIGVIKDIAEEEGDYEQQVPSKKFIKTINWKEIDLDEDAFIMQCYPVSSLPNDPAGRLQTIQEYIQAGYLSPREGRRLLDFPDLDQVESLANAEEEYLNEIFDNMIDDGIYTPPEPFDNLQLCMELAMLQYAQGKQQCMDEEKLELLRKFMGQVQMLQTLANPPQPAPMMAPGAGASPPQAQPMQPPQSNLLPFKGAQ